MINKRTRTTLICIAILVLGAVLVYAAIKLHDAIGEQTPYSIVYNETEYKPLNGKQVSVTGYMSLSSPYMSDLMYLVSTPITGYPTSEESATIGNAIACYAKIGTRFDYTDYPVTVTGTLVMEDVTDYQSFTYKYYLKDCTVAEYSSNEIVQMYRQSIDGGAISYIDELLQKLNKVLVNKEAQEIDLATLDEKWHERMGSINCQELQVMYDAASSLAKACVAYQEGNFPDEGELKDNVTAANTELVQAMDNWVQACKLRGDEHETK